LAAANGISAVVSPGTLYAIKLSAVKNQCSLPVDLQTASCFQPRPMEPSSKPGLAFFAWFSAGRGISHGGNILMRRCPVKTRQPARFEIAPGRIVPAENN
jgi:hypothetical protein